MINHEIAVNAIRETKEIIQASTSTELIMEKACDLITLLPKLDYNDQEVINEATCWLVFIVDHLSFGIQDKIFSLALDALDHIFERANNQEDQQVFYTYRTTSKNITKELHGLKDCFFEDGYNDCQEGEKGYEQACQLKAAIERLKEKQMAIDDIYDDYCHNIIDIFTAVNTIQTKGL